MRQRFHYEISGNDIYCTTHDVMSFPMAIMTITLYVCMVVVCHPMSGNIHRALPMVLQSFWNLYQMIAAW
jgi:hypothetical protein